MATNVDPPTARLPEQRQEEQRRQEQRHGFTNCRLLYATQSGRAKACARRVARLLQTHTTLAVQRPASLDETLGGSLRQVITSWKADKKTQQTLVILFVSTTGDGEPPDNMRRTWTQW
jgi:sulfite reductase alpha subunit-like flavoprotein